MMQPIWPLFHLATSAGLKIFCLQTKVSYKDFAETSYITLVETLIGPKHTSQMLWLLASKGSAGARFWPDPAPKLDNQNKSQGHVHGFRV